jgi:saccharopepsin
MKTTGVVAAAALLGSATAKVHKLKLDKVPLSEQFVWHLFPVFLFPVR